MKVINCIAASIIRVNNSKYCSGHVPECAEYYGFLLEDNPHDTVFLPPALFSPVVKELSDRDCYLHANGVPSWELMKALRLGCEHPRSRKAAAHLAAAGQLCSGEGELKVSRFLMYSHQFCGKLGIRFIVIRIGRSGRWRLCKTDACNMCMGCR